MKENADALMQVNELQIRKLELEKLNEELQASLAQSRLNEELYKSIVNSQTDFVNRFLHGGIMTYVNPALVSFSGVDEESLLGNSFYPFIHQDDLPELISRIEAIRIDNPVVETVNRTVFPDGSFCWNRWTYSGIFDDQKNLVEYQAVGRDITRQIRAEEKLHNSAESLKAIIRTAMDGFWLLDTGGHILEVNETYCRLSGYSEQEIRSMSLADLVIEESIEHIEARTKKLMTDGEDRFESQHRRKDGSIFDVEVSAQYQPIEDGRCVAFIRDITQRKQVETAIRDSENRFRTLFENTPNIAVQGYYLDGTVHFWNSASEMLYGYSSSEAVGSNLLDLIIPPEMKTGVTEAIREMRETGEPIPASELLLMRKDGSRVPVFSSHALITPVARQPELYCLDIDLTELKIAGEELQKKNIDIEKFLYTISHDLRTPLVTIKTFMGYLEQDIAGIDQERLTQDLNYINSAADKMKLLLDELLEFSRIDHVKAPRVRISFKEIVADVLDSLAGVISEHKVDILVSDTDRMMIGERLHLGQIWQNIIENSIKYSSKTISPRIELGVQQEGAETVFYVKDNGIGIDPQYHHKIFGLFEKLDPKSPGAGLGLSMIRRIVEKYNGRIWVESEGNHKGSCFFFTLPHAMIQT